MRRARSSGSPVSLFTFLDVLVGTLGALIVLLLAITRQAQISHEATFAAAEAEAVEDLPPLPERVELPPLPPLPPLPELELEERLATSEPLPELPPLIDPRAELAAKRDELKTRLERLGAEESPADHQATDRLASLTKYLKDLQARLDQLVDTEKAEQEAGAGLKVELDKLREQLRNAGRGSDHVENRYAVVPYIGPNGTQRQPIYLECRKESITLRPEGIAFGPELLGRPEDPDNPLATTVRALVNELKRDARGADGVPYPLLLVRPDGIAAYYLAQRALESVDLPVGYELIDEGIELDFPAPNEKTAAVARTVVSAFERQMGIANAGGSRSGSLNAPYPDFGGTVGAGAANTAGPGGAAGVGGNRWEPPGPAGFGSTRGAPGIVNGDDRLAASRGNGGSAIGGLQGGLGNSGAPSIEEASRLFDAGPAGRASLTGQPGGFSGGPGSLKGNEPGNGANPEESEGESGQGPGGGTGQPRAVASLPGLRPGGSALGQPGAGDEASEGGAAGNGDGPLRAASGPNGTDGRRPGNGGGLSVDGTPGATGGGLAMANPGTSGTAQAGLPGASSSEGAGGDSAGAGAAGGAAGGVAGSGAAPGAEGSQEAGAPPNGQSVGGSFSDLGADGLKVGGNDPASPLAVGMNSANPERRSFDDMLFDQPKERGTRPSEEVDPDTFVPPGGLSRSGRGVSGLKVSRRPVRRAVMIECREDGVILYPGRGYLPLPPTAPTSAAELAARQLHQHVLKVVQGWGLPGTMHYWQPVVLFYVRPDGLANYYSMRFALMNSKLEIQHQVIDWNAILELPKWNNNVQTSSLPDRVFR